MRNEREVRNRIPFDIVATKAEKKNVFMIATHLQEVNEEAAIGFFAKTYDCKPQRSILLGIPRLSTDALRLAELYRIEVFEGAGLDDILKKQRSTFM